MAVTHRVRYIAPAALVSLLCASAAPAQTAAPAAAFAGPGVSVDKSVDTNLQVPRCLRRGSALEPAQKVVPGTSVGFITRLVPMTTCSLGLELPPLTARERRSEVDGDAGPGVAMSFDQLAVLVRPGNTVTLTDASGSEVYGRIETLSSSALSLAIDGTRRDFLATDVVEIRQRRGDSLANGAKWGFGIGVGLFALAIAGCDECRPTSAGEYALTAFAGGLYGALGTGIGVGIDALKRGEPTIYRRPGLSASVRF
jgi:hypothetical protein